MPLPRPALLLALLAACDRSPEAAPPAASATLTAAEPPARPDDPALTACRARLDQLRAAPALPGAPAFEARRAEILGRAKGEAVVWLRAPARTAALTPRQALLDRQMRAKSPLLGLASASDSLKNFPEDARALLLAEGYVYRETPEEASALVDVLRLGRLFRDKEIWLARGPDVMRLERDEKYGVYRHADGEKKGDEATVVHGDRVAARRDELRPFLHRDLSAVVDEQAPDQVRIERLTEQGAVVSLRYGSDWVPAALDDDGARYRVSCVAPEPGRATAVAQVRQANRRRARSVARLREAIGAMVAERLRFDEPLEEVGQQDGSLRPAWRWAYDHGATGYRFNDIGYPVFDASGRPSPPQVCVDFVLDAYERASGRWFGGSTEPRERSAGSIDFDRPEFNRRSAAELVTLARSQPIGFLVRDLPDDERIPFGHRTEFFRYLSEHAADFLPGTIVVIHGMKDDGKPHYHSFLVEASDPLTGFPYRLAGNAGRPRLQSWESTMRSAPLRSIRHLLQPREDWLAAALPPRPDRLAER